MLYQVMRSLVFGLMSVMLLPAMALATIGPPTAKSDPATLAGWLVLASAGAMLVWAFGAEVRSTLSAHSHQ